HARPRSEYGLPEDGVVFACFNQTVKYAPEVFERWMSLLRANAGSVLWLLEDNAWATGKLKAAAQADGVDASRLVCAPRVSTAQHLARYVAADIALDT